MRWLTRVVALALPLCLGLVPEPREAAASQALYVNNYGSDWGLWARGHCILNVTDTRYVFRIEELSLEPNHNYPQAFEVSGLRLAYSYRDKRTGELLEDGPGAGRLAGFAARLTPGQRQVVRAVELEAPRGRPPRIGEALVLELQVVMRSGAVLGIAVHRFEGK